MLRPASKYFSLLLGLVLLPFLLIAQNAPIELRQSNDPIIVSSELQIFRDTSAKMDLGQVQKQISAFQVFDPEQNLSKADVYWGRLLITNPEGKPIRWVLSPDWNKGTRRNSFVEVHILSELGPTSVLHTGKYLPLSQKDGIAKVYPQNQVELNLAAGETQEVYIRIEPIEQRRPVFAVQLMSYDYWLDQAPNLRNILQAIFHAIMWFMCISSLLNYFSKNGNAYLYYALFLAATSFYFLSVSGMLMEIFLQEHPKTNSTVWVFASNLLGIGYFQFARSFLNTKKLMPLWDRIGRYIIIGALILIALELVILQLTFNFDFLEKLNRLVLFLEVSFLLVVSLVHAKYSKGMWRIFFWGTLCIIAAGYLGLTLDSFGLFHASLPAVELLFVIQTLNFSWGLGFRQSYLQAQRLNEKAKNENLSKLNEMKSRFFDNISHEFRTPLTILIGVANRLRKDWQKLPAKQVEQELTLLEQEGKNLNELVNQILDLSKLDSHSYEANWQYGDLIEEINQIAEAFQTLAQLQEKTFAVEADFETLPMDLDPRILQSILGNLLSNAFKFTPKGGSVRLGLRKEDGPQMEEQVLMEVADTGFGIPKKEIKHLFDRYFQSSTNQEKSAGTGIGLSLVKALTEVLGGEVWVESTVDKGTSFFVRLPIKQLYKDQQKAESSPEIALPVLEESRSAERSVAPNFGQNLVLIVEDNPAIVKYLRSILESDYRLAVARDGAEGEKLALEMIPDLIVSDVSMPNKDGLMMTESLKQDERTSHIPIILLTARAEEKDRLAGLTNGADAYLTKPFRREELEIRIQKLIELRESMRKRFAGQEAAAESQAPPSREQIFIEQLQNIILANLLNPELSADFLAEKLNLSYTQLYRKLKALTNQSASVFIRKVRLEEAAKLLKAGEESVSEVAYQTGFSDPAYFSRAFSQQFEMPPSVYREN
ncbi:MAG: ATP-binding protein [Bacteroidota bacterium]